MLSIKRFLYVPAILIAAAVAIGQHTPAAEPPVRDGVAAMDKIDLFFSRLPEVVEVTPGGEAVIEWETKAPAPAAIVYFGAWSAGEAADGPRFGHTVLEKLASPSATHSVRLDLKLPTAGKYAVAERSVSGAYTVMFRVETYDPKQQRARLWDGRLGFVIEDGKFIRVPCVTLGPFVANVKSGGAVLWLETDLPVSARLDVYEKGGTAQPRSFASDTPAARHEIAASGLSPDTVYTYMFVLKGADGRALVLPEYHLTTAPAQSDRTGSFSFAIMADSRAASGGPEQDQDSVNSAAVRELAEKAYSAGARFIIFTGDMIDGYTTSREDFENQMRTWYKAIERPAHYIPFYTVPGNHDTYQYWYNDGVYFDRDGDESSEALFAKMVVNPGNAPPPEDSSSRPYAETVYSFDFGGCHFSALNTEYWYTKHPQFVPGNLRGNIMKGQLNWLEADMADARARGMKTLFVFAHEPAFPNGGHLEDAMWYNGKKPEIIEMRNRFWGMLVKNRAAAGLFAHEHNYSRTLIDSNIDPAFTVPIWQITAGGAGAPAVTREENAPWAANVKAFSSRQHFVLFTVNQETGDIFFRTVAISGETIDEGKL